MLLNFYASLFHKALNFLPFFLNLFCSQRLLIISTDVLPVIFMAVALPSFIHRFLITQNL